MKRKLDILVVYLTGLIQGLALVTVPAASSVLTDPRGFGFSESAYGGLFIPQVMMAIIGALAGPRLAKRFGPKKVFQAGLMFNVLAMAAISASQLFVKNPAAAYACFIIGTTAVGAGFGITLPMINVFSERLFPQKSASALTALHTLLGTGTALAPVFVSILVKGLGWSVLPNGAFLFLAVIFVMSFKAGLTYEVPQSSAAEVSRWGLFQQRGMVLFLVIVFLYGYCETIFANWAIIYLKKDVHVDAGKAGYALAVFWALVTGGRLLVSIISIRISPLIIYRILPAIIAAALAAVGLVSNLVSGLLVFGLAGLACSAFFPLSFSLAQKRFASMADTVSGALMASYMLGYGFSSYGVGKMVEVWSWPLKLLYMYSTTAAVLLVVLVFMVTRISSANA